MAGLQGFKKVKNVTLPLFKWENGVERYYRFESEMFVGKTVAKAGGDKPMEPATLANVTDLETGELGQIIIGTALKGIIHDEYIALGVEYQGKCFAITQTKVPEKRYNMYTVTEIESDEAQVTAETKADEEATPATGKRSKR